MSWQEWFIFESKKQREAKQKAYFKRIYPMGEEEQKWERAMYKQLFPKLRHPEDMIFETIVLREALLNAQLDPDDKLYKPESEGVSKWERSKLTKFLKPEEKATVMAMAYLMNAAGSLEELPTEEQIREKAKAFMPQKP